jgi:MFS family permease
VFFLGSVAAVFAPNIGFLIGCRILQGVGAAVFPLSFSIIRDEFPREKVPVAVGAVSSVFAIGGGVGLVLSGVILDSFSWRWIFGLGAAAVAAAVVLVHLFVPESPIKTPSRVDVIGGLLLSAGLVALLLGLTEGESWGWSSGRIMGLFAVGVVLLVAWGLVELHVPEPMVDMRMLARRPVFFTNLTALIGGAAMFGSFVLVPTLLQLPNGLPERFARLADYGFGADATTTGLYLLPSAVMGLASGPLAGVMGKRWGSKWPLSLGMALGAVGLGLIAEWHSEPWHIVLGMVFLGAGLPMTFAGMATIIVETVRPSETGVATGINTVMRTIGGVIGAQVGAAILTAQTIGDTPVPAEGAFATAFWISAAGTAIAAIVALLITPRARRAPAEAAVESA